MGQAIDSAVLNKFNADFNKIPAAQVIKNSVANNGIYKDRKSVV